MEGLYGHGRALAVLCEGTAPSFRGGRGTVPSSGTESGVTFPMPWECTGGRADPMDLDNQVSFCSRHPWQGCDLGRWFCPCSLHTSVLLLVPRILWRPLPQKPRGEQGIFPTGPAGDLGASVEGGKAKKHRRAGFRADLPLFRPCGSLCLYHDPRKASRCLPGPIHARRSREGSSQPWDANAQGFSAEVPDPNQGLFSCSQGLCHGTNPCPAVGVQGDRPGFPGRGRAGHAGAGARLGPVLLLGGPGGHPEVGVPLAGAHICTDVLCAHSCSPGTAGHQPKTLSLGCHRCPARPGCWGHQASSRLSHILR